MILKKNKLIYLFLAVSIIAAGAWYYRFEDQKNTSESFFLENIHPTRGDIDVTVSTTGIVEPKNRLEVKPAINGRIETILVKEGDRVRKGQIVAFMSSTERAALLDAARGQGESVMDYWENVYKATALVSPIDGEVIVRSVEPGQTVTTQNPVIVLSDRLIVKAQVDETDIGLVKPGQKAVIALDAYPDSSIPGVVEHIAYESTVTNNVTVYQVDILPESIPDYFRSGMSANVEITVRERQGVLLIPLEALIENNGSKSVLTRPAADAPPVESAVAVGLSNTHRVEITAGVDENTIVVIKRQKYVIPEEDTGGNPFLPFGSKKKKK